MTDVIAQLNAAIEAKHEAERGLTEAKRKLCTAFIAARVNFERANQLPGTSEVTRIIALVKDHLSMDVAARLAQIDGRDVHVILAAAVVAGIVELPSVEGATIILDKEQP